MHWLDFVLLMVLGVGGLLGLRSGLLWQVARLVIFAAAIYGCVHYHEQVADHLKEAFEGHTEETSRFMAYAVIFLGVCLAGSLITWILEGMLRAAHLKPLDRLLGAAVGILKAALLAGGLLAGLTVYGSQRTRTSMADSHLAPPLIEATRWALAAVEPHIHKEFREKLDQLKQAAEKPRTADK